MKDLAEMKQQFLQYLEIERSRSAKTIENYNRYLERFFAFTKIKSVSQLTEEQIVAFSVHLNSQPGSKVDGKIESMKHGTQNYYLIAIRAFLKFLQKQGIKCPSPKSIELKKLPERSLDLISTEELMSLLSAPDLKTLEGKRDRAILTLLFSTGLRISELCALSVNDFNLSSNQFLVIGKGNKERTVFLSKDAKEALKAYLKARQDLDSALFVRYGRKANDGGMARIQPKAVQRLIKHYATLVGITRKVTPQVIRHSFATDLLSNGADLRSVQALLGHAHIGTTLVYTKVTDKHLSEVHKKFHSQ